MYPLMRMALVVFLFSTIFNKGIPKYPAYYFVGFLIFEFFATATQTSLTTLMDNKNLIIKSKLPREIFVISRVLTAFVNFLLGCIPFILVLMWYRVSITKLYLYIPIVLILLLLFVVGISYILSIWFVFQKDARNVYANIINILRFFVAMFYSVDSLSEGVRQIVFLNPIYSYIKVLREFIVYGGNVENIYFIRIFAWGIGAFLIGMYVFKKCENSTLNRL